MLLNKYEKNFKFYLMVQRKVNELSEKIRKLPLKPLDKPIQKGWNVFIDLRDDIKRRQDYPILKQILDIVYKGRSGYIKKPEHIRMIRKGEKGYYANGTNGQYWVDFSPKPKYIHRREYEKMSELQQKYFCKTHDLWNREHYVLNFPNYYFVLKVKPNILTHYIEKGSELEKEFHYWKDILDNPNNPLWTNYGKSFPSSKDRTRLRNTIQKFKKGEIEDIEINKVPLNYHY